MKSSKKTFTLVELIIVIAIIVILAVTAFLMLTKWIAKSRDSSRLSDINTIDNALQVYLTEKNSLPKPENYTLIYASGTSNIVGYQGDFSDNVAKSLGNLSKAPKDALDNVYYNYYVDSTSTKYQLLGYTENLISSVGNTANAVDYSSRYVRIVGDKLGILTDTNNAPVNKLGLTGVDVALTTGTYKSYFDSSTSVNGTGISLVSMLTLSNKNISYLDTNLVFYSDMETTLNSGGLTMLKDFSKYGNNGIITGNIIMGNANGVKGKGTYFTSGYNYITLHGGTFNNFPSNNAFSMSFYLNSSDIGNNYVGIVNRDWYHYSTSGYALIFGLDNKWNKDALNFCLTNDTKTRSDVFLTGSTIYNSWIFVTFVLNQSSIKIYKNGSLLATTNVNGNFSTGTDLQFPYTAWETVVGSLFQRNAFNGFMDEVRIYNRALSDDEVKALYKAN